MLPCFIMLSLYWIWSWCKHECWFVYICMINCYFQGGLVFIIYLYIYGVVKHFAGTWCKAMWCYSKIYHVNHVLSTWSCLLLCQVPQFNDRIMCSHIQSNISIVLSSIFQWGYGSQILYLLLYSIKLHHFCVISVQRSSSLGLPKIVLQWCSTVHVPCVHVSTS